MDREQGRLDHRSPYSVVSGIVSPSSKSRLRGSVLRPLCSFFLPLALGLAFFAASCSSMSFQYTKIGELSDGTVVQKVTGFPAPSKPPSVGTLSEEDLKASLRRIVVRYHGLISFSKSEPMQLLTVDQVGSFAKVMASEFPTLASNQRIRFSFKDIRKPRDKTEMDVYVDGADIVYYFNMLVANPVYSLNAGDPPFSEAELFEQPGQRTSQALPAAVILLDIANPADAARAALPGILAHIEEQRMLGTVTAEEAAHLKAFAREHPEADASGWRTYWDKRVTLRKAREQSLMDEAAYQTQLKKLEQDLLAK